MCGDQFNKCVWGLNAIVTHEENVTNTLKWRVAEVGTAQSRREATTGDYRKHPLTRRTVHEPFFTSGYISIIYSMLSRTSFDARRRVMNWRFVNIGYCMRVPLHVGR